MSTGSMIMSITSSSTQINQREMIDNDEEIAHRLASVDNSPFNPRTIKRKRRVTHHIIRVGNGKNFETSLNKGLFAFGLKSTWLPCIRKFKPGDVLWFLKNKSQGNKFIGFATFTEYQNLRDNIISFSNHDYGWVGDDDWSILIKYTKLHLFRITTQFKLTVSNSRTIMSYKNRMREQIDSSSNTFRSDRNILDIICKRFKNENTEAYLFDENHIEYVDL